MFKINGIGFESKRLIFLVTQMKSNEFERVQLYYLNRILS